MPKSVIEYCSDPVIPWWCWITWSIIFNLSQHRCSSIFKNTSATTLKSFVDTHPLAAKSMNLLRIWASGNLPIFLLAEIIQNFILVPMRPYFLPTSLIRVAVTAYFSAALNIDPLAFTQMSSYCSSNNASISGKKTWGHSKIWKKWNHKERTEHYCCQSFAQEQYLGNWLVSFYGRFYHKIRNIEPLSRKVNCHENQTPVNQQAVSRRFLTPWEVYWNFLQLSRNARYGCVYHHDYFHGTGRFAGSVNAP